MTLAGLENFKWRIDRPVFVILPCWLGERHHDAWCSWGCRFSFLLPLESNQISRSKNMADGLCDQWEATISQWSLESKLVLGGPQPLSTSKWTYCSDIEFCAAVAILSRGFTDSYLPVGWLGCYFPYSVGSVESERSELTWYSRIAFSQIWLSEMKSESRLSLSSFTSFA